MVIIINSLINNYIEIKTMRQTTTQKLLATVKARRQINKHFQQLGRERHLTLRNSSDSGPEDKDCTITATAGVLGISYDEARDKLTQFHKLENKGPSWPNFLACIGAQGYDVSLLGHGRDGVRVNFDHDLPDQLDSSTIASNTFLLRNAKTPVSLQRALLELKAKRPRYFDDIVGFLVGTNGHIIGVPMIDDWIYDQGARYPLVQDWTSGGTRRITNIWVIRKTERGYNTGDFTVPRTWALSSWLDHKFTAAGKTSSRYRYPSKTDHWIAQHINQASSKWVLEAA